MSGSTMTIYLLPLVYQLAWAPLVIQGWQFEWIPDVHPMHHDSYYPPGLDRARGN